MKTLAAIFLFLIAGAAALHAQDMLRLEDAIAIGLERNHSIRIARGDAEIARNNTTRGSANFLPTLDASGSYTFSRSEQETNSPFSFGNSDTRNAAAQLALNWTLFDGFRMFMDQERYDELAVLGEVQARGVVERTVVSIAAAYFRVVQQSRLLETIEQVFAISRSRYAKERVRRELGGSKSDFLNARIAWHNDSAAVLEQRLQLTIARKDLNLLLGRSPGETFAVERDITLPALPYTDEQLLRMAREHSTDLRASRQGLRVAEAAAGISRSSFYPRVSLVATYGYADRLVSTDQSERFSGDITTQSSDASIGLNFSFNLFNGFRNTTDVQNARIETRIAEITLDETEQRIEGLLLERREALRTRLDAVAIEELNLDAARQNLDLQVERFETGAVTALEFRDAQVQFVRAETAYIVSLYEARIALLELQRLIGEVRI